jgi:nucleotide-binding universal stress UspA family protein
MYYYFYIAGAFLVGVFLMMLRKKKVPPPVVVHETSDIIVNVPEKKKKHQRLLDNGVSHLTSKGFRATGSLLSGDVVSEIANHASAIRADLIVVGHRQEKSWVRRWWSNSTAKSLVEVAPCSVLMVVVRDR